jgi:hypothetical protein
MYRALGEACVSEAVAVGDETVFKGALLCVVFVGQL